MDTSSVANALIGIAEVAGNLYMIDEDFEVPQFFVSLMDFIQHGLVIENPAGPPRKAKKPPRI